MKNNVAYFKSHLKDNLTPLIYITVLVFMLSLILSIYLQPYRIYDANYDEPIIAYRSCLAIPSTVIGILAYIIPFQQFSIFKKRRNLDCFYSLPISRREIGVVHYLTGLIILAIPYTVSYTANLVLLLVRNTGMNFSPMIAHFFITLILGAVLYTSVTFIINQANSVTDGCVFCVLWSFVFLLITGAIIFFESTFVDSLIGAFPWSAIDIVTTHFQKLVENSAESDTVLSLGSAKTKIISIIWWVAIGIASFFGFFYTFGKRAPEKTEELSDSYFGYRIMIPVYAISGIFALWSVIFWVFICATAFVGYAIYRRSFHFKKTDYVMLGIILLTMIFSYVFGASFLGAK